MTTKTARYTKNDLIASCDATWLLLHEVKTFEQARDALLDTLPIQLGDADTYDLAALLDALVRAINR